MKYTKSNLTKTEEILKNLSYALRYEKGNFQSGYCIVDAQKVIVINKFYDTEGRINVLLDILSTIRVDESLLSEASQKMYGKIKKEFNYNSAEEE